ncbi:hypothetical protein TESG_08432 [Trichophyton tonsurans CBS 112818]|uniref:Uncharacterized protein n=1 Tax=Trichophyton tonsurans (strain CBS 112818) TaxID=647933 RepID=F2RYB9_TRIT1|nr:hypothetical protein TESG_08432 [Trichophyton tonsurans CBS 112818]
MGVTKFVMADGSGDYPAQNDKLLIFGRVIIPEDLDYKDFCIRDGSVISGSITLGFELGVSYIREGEQSLLSITRLLTKGKTTLYEKASGAL